MWYRHNRLLLNHAQFNIMCVTVVNDNLVTKNQMPHQLTYIENMRKLVSE